MTAKRLYFALIAACVLMLAGIGAGIYYGDQLLAKQAQRIATARAEEELIDQQKKVKTDLEAKIAELAEVEHIAEKFLPEQKNQDILTAEFADIAKRNNIIIQQISYDQSAGSPSQYTQTQALKDLKNVSVLPFSVLTEPVTFEELMNFLKDIENNRRKMQIVNIGVMPITEPGPNHGKLNISEMRLEVYVKGTNEAVTPGAKTPSAAPASN